MIIRLTFLEIPNEKVEDLKKLYQEELMPAVRQQKGNLECKLLEPVNAEDEYISMTVWESQEDAVNYSSSLYRQLVGRVKEFLAKEPVLREYTTQSIFEHA